MAAERPLDNDLLAALRGGDVSALELVYERFGGMVYGVALRLTGNPAEAEDTVQDVFLALPESMATLRLPSAFGGWLKKVTVRAALDRQRAARRRYRAEGRVSEIAAPPARDRPIRRLQLERAISDLPPKLRTVFVLYDVEGFSHGEIAEMLGITPNASMQRVHRARTHLRGRLAD